MCRPVLQGEERPGSPGRRCTGRNSAAEEGPWAGLVKRLVLGPVGTGRAWAVRCRPAPGGQCAWPRGCWSRAGGHFQADLGLVRRPLHLGEGVLAGVPPGRRDGGQTPGEALPL